MEIYVKKAEARQRSRPYTSHPPPNVQNTTGNTFS